MNNTQCPSRGLARMVATAVVVLGALWASTTLPVAAQTNYVYFPSARTDDGRFLTMAGAGLNTLGEDIVLKIGAARTTDSIEVGIFDGETGGRWDIGSLQMQYRLYADPAANGTGTTLIAQWDGGQMPDNAWFSAKIANVASARSAVGDYFYRIVVHNPDITVPNVWSNFKVRTSGSVVALVNHPIAYTAPIMSLADAQTIYPGYPTLTPTTYDGTWSFFLLQPVATPTFTVWDGDMDFGSYDCSIGDDDDPDTPDSTLPPWAVGTMAVHEGIAASTIACTDASGANTGGTTTSNPPDDSRNAIVRRGPNVSYQVISPNNVHYANNNPSGNLEWEQFELSTAPFNRSQMDYHADSLPAGIYEVRIAGVDMNNLNAFRFPLDALGVDANNMPVLPISANAINGTISGTIYYESGSNGQQDAGEPGIPTVDIMVTADYNGDGIIDATFTATTDVDGHYSFTGLLAGTYTVTVDLGTLSDDLTPITDVDGTATPSSATFTLSMTARTEAASFGYKRINSVGTRTRGYWVNHPNVWPVDMLRLGSVYYSEQEAIGILQRATAGDKTYIMAAQLIATKLNLADGCDASCIAPTVADADTWLSHYPLGSKVKSWNGGDVTQARLDDYNNGRLCVGHMN